jgi:glycosyltransferase involved in cell wall biosynthesis
LKDSAVFFSVIIPVYNRSHFIGTTIDTVLAQTYPHFEVIVIDDGSTEDIKEVIDNSYGIEQRVKYFHKQNEERGAARNFGLKHSSGDYAVFFDSDDLMQTHYLETLVSIIKENPEIKLLAAKYNFTNDGKIETHSSLQNLAEGWYDRSFFLKGNMLACNFCIKLKDHNFKLFPPEKELASMEDWLFLLLNLEESKIFIKDKICISMRQHDERSMSNNQKVIQARIRATSWALKNIDLSSSEQKNLVAWSHYFCGVHQYLDHNRKGSVKEVIAAMKEAGLRKDYIMLLIKSIIGRKLIKKIQ